MPKRRRVTSIAALLASALCAGPLSAQSRCALPETPGAPVGPEPWCAELVPVPDLRNVRAVLELNAPPTPFGIAVTQDGRHVHDVFITIDGLPEASTLGARTYVAWATDLALDDAVKLGTVHNGRNVLGRVARNQFRVLVTAERNADVSERAGRIVLRGTSPSVKLLAHRDIAASGMPGVQTDTAGHGHTAQGGSWPMPPMDSTMPMMRGMSGLVPAIQPFRPGEGIDIAALPAARPRTILRMKDGDTLRLVAGLVRKRIGTKQFVMYAFNEQQPGPLIDVAQRATIVVEFENRLELPSAIHWHGVRLDNRFDGAPGVTQDPVPPGGRFTYRVHFLDAGLYWYHPHVREDIQQDLGLYGNMRVRSADADWLSPVHRDEVLMLDDLLIAEYGLFPWGRETATHALMGRFGNVFLINGEPQWSMRAAPGEVVRLWLTNVSNTRIYNVSIDGARLKLVGGDIGRYEREVFVESIVLAPAERAIVDVRFDSPGRHAIANRIQSVSHMLGTYAATVDTLGIVDVQGPPASAGPGQEFDTLRQHADVIREFDVFRGAFDRPVDRELTLGMNTDSLSGALLSTMLLGYAPPFDWNDGMPMMNWLMTARDVRWTLRDPATGRENMDIAWRFHVGDVVRLRLQNPATAFHPMSHPVHIHGQRFVVLSRNGVRNDNLVWKDTVVVGVGETVDILLELSNPGRWMIHCHIAEHLGAGMMSVFTVE
jgi:FtsP/CotA-like multicopper oxidase with cupredoxin domain